LIKVLGSSYSPTHPLPSQVARARLSSILQDLEAPGVGQDNLNHGIYEMWGRRLMFTMGVSTHNTPEFHKIMTWFQLRLRALNLQGENRREYKSVDFPMEV
jgi:predicted secreted Zn-dependent protease